MEQFIIGGLSVLVVIFVAVIVAGLVVLKGVYKRLAEHTDDQNHRNDDIWREFEKHENKLEQQIAMVSLKADAKFDEVIRKFDEVYLYISGEVRGVNELTASNLDSRLDKLLVKLGKS